MIEKKLAEIIIRNLGVEPTLSQQQAIDDIARFLFDDDPQSLYLLKGYAGTGKTLLISSLVQSLKPFRIQTQLLAPTGRAAKVLSGYALHPAYTVHKKIYRQQSSSDGTGKFVLDFNKHQNTLFIVDEASMIANGNSDYFLFGSGRLLDDLIEYVYNGKNCRLMLAGDTAQLPPVGLVVSEALDTSYLSNYSLKVYTSVLSDVIRQSLESGILHNATSIRLHLRHKTSDSFVPIRTEGMDDLVRIGGERLIDEIGDCYDRYGIEETIVITRSNKRANLYNEGIRRTILWRESELEAGDYLMVVKNNYHYVHADEGLAFVANGDIAKVVKVHRTEEIYGFRFATVTLLLSDYNNLEIECKIFLDTLTLEGPSFGQEDNQRLFEQIQTDYLHIRNKADRWKEIRENEYFNALQVKYAYAVTCHKAQGGQWDAVFVDHGFLSPEKVDIGFLRWLYTAFTRPRKKLYLVNFDKHFFQNPDSGD
ncbi:MAG TPA: AAA family ATPase [Prolixibacteraceae bacterium]|nr:AAA family ATPase [Prolixibacteraceae bacterium]